jgi:hypothetical protein
MKIYITKYALTTGIETAEAETTHTPTMMWVKRQYGGIGYHGTEWHFTLEDAIAQAEKMRAAKLKSIEKQSTKIKMMDFTVIKQN